MSLLSELNTIAESCGVPVETGIFSDVAPDTYLVLTPLSDSFDLHADNQPSVDVQEIRLSLFCKENYTKIKNALVRALLAADVTVTSLPWVPGSPLATTPVSVSPTHQWPLLPMVGESPLGPTRLAIKSNRTL